MTAKPAPTSSEERSSGEVATINFHLTDTGNAERFVARNRGNIHYVPPRRRWITWDEKRWAWDLLGAVDQLGKKTVRAIYAEAEHARDKDQVEVIIKHAMASEKRERRAAMVALAQTEPGVPVLPQGLDADPWAFNCANGTLDLRTGELRPHAREDLITKLAPVAFVPGATSTLWERYLADATGGDVELAGYLQRAVGYALQGQVTEKCFWFLFGPPDGMKSTFIDAVSNTLGDYAVPAAFTTWLVQTNTGGNRGDLVALMGARLVTSVEVRKGAKFDEEILKRITGGDLLTAAAKYEAETTFPPSFALWLAANDSPVIRDDDEGAWSRVRRIPFVHPLPPEKRDPTMRERLRAPDVQQAILSWAVEGCLAWQRHGLGTCRAVEVSTAEYREDMDRAASFFAERCWFGAAEITSKELREGYEAWCRENGVRHPLTSKELGARLRAKGCEQGKLGTCRARSWRGLRLLRDWELPQEQDSKDSRGQQSPETLPVSGEMKDLPETRARAVRCPDDVDEMERAAIQAEGTP